MNTLSIRSAIALVDRRRHCPARSTPPHGRHRTGRGNSPRRTGRKRRSTSPIAGSFRPTAAGCPAVTAPSNDRGRSRGTMKSSRTHIGNLAPDPAGEPFLQLGIMHASGRSGPADLVAAHKWFNIAAMQGNVRGGAAAARNRQRNVERGDCGGPACRTRMAEPALSPADQAASRPARVCQQPRLGKCGPDRSISARSSLTSGGRTVARGSRPSMTSASFIRLCMSIQGSAIEYARKRIDPVVEAPRLRKIVGLHRAKERGLQIRNDAAAARQQARCSRARAS